MMTHSRVILLQQPSNIVAQRKFSPARDPCSVLWDVWQWDDLVTMELTHGKKDHPNASPSRLLLYLHIKSTEVKENVRIITCTHDTHQALEVYSSIERARNTYRTYSIKEIVKRKVMKPYSPLANGTAMEVCKRILHLVFSRNACISPLKSTVWQQHSMNTHTEIWFETFCHHECYKTILLAV